MNISATVKSTHNKHDVTVQTNNNAKPLAIPVKATGYGSSANGGELLTLALATCFCNDIYREAARLNIPVSGVEVTCNAVFGAEGEPGSSFTYQINIASTASSADIDTLIEHTDKVAEIHNTLRQGASVTLVK